MNIEPLPAGGAIQALAQSLDCFSEPELCQLADITPVTAESWRKRGKGPAYILFGNRYLYPRKSVAEHLQSLIRERNPQPARGVL